MPRCEECNFMAENRTGLNVRHKKGMMRPHKKYCTNGRFKELTRRTLSGYDYPVWCPLNECQKTCFVCGTLIREEEGDYCKKHR